MVLNLKTALPHSYDKKYRSHPHKFLRVHMDGVMGGVRRHTGAQLAEVAALFHDLGKLNPNFQPKLDNKPVSGYDHHAYLSAHVFLCFCKTSPRLLSQQMGMTKAAQLFSVLMQIAHHHGNLSDMTAILSESERERLKAFLASKPELPVSDYLQQWLPHASFDALDTKHLKIVDDFARMKDEHVASIKNKLCFFFETQFDFACLIESDKRDAGDNKYFRRDEDLLWASAHFTPALNKALTGLPSDNPLNQARLAIREEAVGNLQTALAKGLRTFALTAPTGAGKTFALLALADTIRQYVAHVEEKKTGYAVVYALPFLTITEQVEGICRDLIFSENTSFVTRLDSRSQDLELERLLDELELEPDKSKEILQRSFSQDTWDAAFIITTFVQLFETLMSNRGATLLRLPNFAKCIFLLDEVQSLPPRLYVFFTAYLQAFCEKYDCYVVLSTATMPALELPDAVIAPDENPHLLFPNYNPPAQLLTDHAKYYKLPVFNRYLVTRLDEHIPDFSLDNLAEIVRQADASCLIILNTIEDTRRLYEHLCGSKQCEDVILLNTHFTLKDRRTKIARCKERLDAGEKIVLISTQLIEAGVDIDFPAVYRDMCPLPSLIQSAGRCNRNGKRDTGHVYFFELHSENKKSRAEVIYRDRADKGILDFSREHIKGKITESDLLPVQTAYFQRINAKLAVGDHPLFAGGQRQDDNLIKRINQAAFEVVGSFRLIDDNVFGEEYRYYVSPDASNTAWKDLKAKRREFGIAIGEAEKAGGKLSYAEAKPYQIAIDAQLRQMSDHVVQVRVQKGTNPLPVEKDSKGEPELLYGLHKLLAPERDYSFHTGIDLNRTIIALI